ncbi:hypothetical protein [Streptomyces sp. NPDC052107]|uniref:hypothetical protein n=1 Tax=Streptomyces sp. NPDC052107 TaxID=3155632 RepID=UPI003446876E
MPTDGAAGSAMTGPDDALTTLSPGLPPHCAGKDPALALEAADRQGIDPPLTEADPGFRTRST